MNLENIISRIIRSNFFEISDLDQLLYIYNNRNGECNKVWSSIKHSKLNLPDDLCLFLKIDPFGIEAMSQILKTWSFITNNSNYAPLMHEQTHDELVDPIRRPAFFNSRNADAISNASNHIFATAMILQVSELKPGNWVLEYGAGFAQTALTLARLGVNVDTVDISSQFNQYVDIQSKFFNVNLNAYFGEFGFNPRYDHSQNQYDVILFYESFHHCLNFISVVDVLKETLVDGGSIIMAGEPITPDDSIYLPYPWGIRLDIENILIMRQRGWMELGFQRSFFIKLFIRKGFEVKLFKCSHSFYGDTWRIKKRKNEFFCLIICFQMIFL